MKKKDLLKKEIIWHYIFNILIYIMSLNDDEKKILSKIQLFQKAVSLYKLVRSDINRLQVYSYADDFTFFFFII